MVPRLTGSFSLLVMSPKKAHRGARPLRHSPAVHGKLPGGVLFASRIVRLRGHRSRGWCGTSRLGKSSSYQTAKFIPTVPTCQKIVPVHLRAFILPGRTASSIPKASTAPRLESGAAALSDPSVDADLVIGVPDSDIIAAIGFSRASGIPYGEGFSQNRYIGRTFIQPTQECANPA